MLLIQPSKKKNDNRKYNQCGESHSQARTYNGERETSEMGVVRREDQEKEGTRLSAGERRWQRTDRKDQSSRTVEEGDKA